MFPTWPTAENSNRPQKIPERHSLQPHLTSFIIGQKETLVNTNASYAGRQYIPCRITTTKKMFVPTDLRHMFVILQAFHIDLNHLPDPILFMHCDLKKALFNQ